MCITTVGYSQLMIPFGHVCPYKGYAGLPVRARGSSILHFFVNRGEYKHTMGIMAGALNNNKPTSQFSKWLPNIYLTDWPKLFLQTDFFLKVQPIIDFFLNFFFLEKLLCYL